MHGEINLRSELGQGTTTTFWIPFNKTQATKLGSPLIDARSVPEMSRSDTSRDRCFSAPQSVVEDSLQSTPSHFISRSGSGLGAMTPEEGSIQESVQQEVDRKSIHVLVVEDKYVAIPSRVCSVVSMNKFADLPVAVL